MTWTQRILFAQMGTLFGVLSLYTVVAGMERYLFFIMIVVTGLIVAWLARERFLREGFILGFMTWYLAILVQGVFIDIYLENNPQYRDLAEGLPMGEQMATLLGGIIIAPGYGLLSGVVAYLANLVRVKISR